MRGIRSRPEPLPCAVRTGCGPAGRVATDEHGRSAPTPIGACPGRPGRTAARMRLGFVSSPRADPAARVRFVAAGRPGGSGSFVQIAVRQEAKPPTGHARAGWIGPGSASMIHCARNPAPGSFVQIAVRGGPGSPGTCCRRSCAVPQRAGGRWPGFVSHSDPGGMSCRRPAPSSLNRSAVPPGRVPPAQVGPVQHDGGEHDALSHTVGGAGYQIPGL